MNLALLTPRTQIELRGTDRAAFLHNLCTNEIRRLPVGGGCEAFLTNVQGKVLAHVFVWALPESLVIDTVGGRGEKLMAHLDRYLIREQVELIDRSHQCSDLLLTGPQADEILNRAGTLPDETIVRRVEIAHPNAFMLSTPAESATPLFEALQSAGAEAMSAETLEVARIEAGFPWFGQDITEDNLAPEVGRDRQAISYVKGCYLGQETIARIDALGHVNRLLVGVAFESADVPPRGTELSADGKVVGHVTSAVFSPKLKSPLALAYVRRGHNEPGSQLTSPFGPAAVVRLPLAERPA